MSDIVSLSGIKTLKLKCLYAQTVRPAKTGKYSVEKKERKGRGENWGQGAVKSSEEGKVRLQYEYSLRTRAVGCR